MILEQEDINLENWRSAFGVKGNRASNTISFYARNHLTNSLSIAS